MLSERNPPSKKSMHQFDYEHCFYHALRIRKVEEKIVELYPSDIIQSPVHLSIGQEHHIAAISQAVEPNSGFFTSYRSHALFLARGGDLTAMFAELFGRQSGIAKGKAGSMHLCDPKIGLMGSSAIVAATLSHAAGFAFSQKQKKSPQKITVSVSGDGSMEEGTFYETLNMSALLQLPVLFVIEDNGLAIEAIKKPRQAFNVKKLCEAFSVPYEPIENGFDFSQCYQKTMSLKEQCLREQKPAVLEIKTCRFYDHVGTAPMTTPEVIDWRKRDPLINDQEQLLKWSPMIDEEISRAVTAAASAPFPEPNQLLENVYG